MTSALVVNFAFASADGMVEGSRSWSELGDVEVGDAIQVMDGGDGPFEAVVVEIDGDTIRARVPAFAATQIRR
jgi:transcription antitermination factor NusG